MPENNVKIKDQELVLGLIFIYIFNSQCHLYILTTVEILLVLHN